MGRCVCGVGRLRASLPGEAGGRLGQRLPPNPQGASESCPQCGEANALAGPTCFHWGGEGAGDHVTGGAPHSAQLPSTLPFTF